MDSKEILNQYVVGSMNGVPFNFSMELIVFIVSTEIDAHKISFEYSAYPACPSMRMPSYVSFALKILIFDISCT